MSEIKKAIIPIAGLATRFLPLSKAVPKELWPLVDKPVIQYIIDEVIESGIQEIIFVVKPKEKKLQDYMKPCADVEKKLKEKKEDKILEEVKDLENSLSKMTFSYVVQKKPLGDGHALLQATKKVKDEPVASLFADDIVYAKVPCILQLEKIYKTCQKPVVALYKLPQEKLGSYGVPNVEKITNRLYKIKEIIEKPDLEKALSNFAIVGKHVLIPEVFYFLKKAKPSAKGEIILAEVFENMLKNGKIIYGYEFEGKWLECGNKLEWLKSNIFLGANHPKIGKEIREFLKGL